MAFQQHVRRPLLVAPGRLAVLAALAMVAGACSSGADVATTDPNVDPTSTTTVGPSTTGGPPTSDGGTTREGSDLPADQVVWQVDTGGGLVPYSYAANDVPEVTVYGDGRIFVPVAPAPDEAPPGPVPAPVQLTVGSVPADELQAFLDDVESSGLIDERVDYGTPQITDMPGTSVRLHGTGEPSAVNVYALGGDFDDGLEPSQTDDRQALEALIERSEDLAEDAKRWVPDRVELVDLAVGEAPPSSSATKWPGPPFVDVFATADPDATVGRSRCASLDGDDAAAVFEAALGSSHPFIDLRGAELQVVIKALLPGEEPCDGP